jgi:hypothetical protein
MLLTFLKFELQRFFIIQKTFLFGPLNFELTRVYCISDISYSPSLKTMASLMFIPMVNPPVRSFNPEHYVKQWLDKATGIQITWLVQLYSKIC